MWGEHPIRGAWNLSRNVPESEVNTETSPKGQDFFLLYLQFGFHAKDNGEIFNDSESGNDVMGLTILLRLDWRVLKLDAGKLFGRLLW